ncbi:hypothetical protein ACHAW6_010358 [Cyclotella cf. meneghiniana]
MMPPVRGATSSSAIILVILTLAISTLSPTAHSFSLTTAPSNRFDTTVAVDDKCTVHVHPPPHARADNVTLTTYMRLPVEQYVLIPMPLGSSLTRVGGCNNDWRQQSNYLADGDDNAVEPTCRSTEELFELVVPTIKFFSLSLQPVVYATVQPQFHRVIISSNKCILHGSPFIEKVKLNDRFIFQVRTTLTWNDALSRNQNMPTNFDRGTQQIAMRHRDKLETMSASCSISAETCIHVDVDVPRPFRSIPKAILQSTGNAAMKVSMKYIQASFLQNLARDYEKWAYDLEYRKFRASLSRDDPSLVSLEL